MDHNQGAHLTNKRDPPRSKRQQDNKTNRNKTNRQYDKKKLKTIRRKDKGLPGVKDERAGGGREIEDHVGASEQPAHICSSCQFRHFGRASNKLAKLRLKVGYNFEKYN